MPLTICDDTAAMAAASHSSWASRMPCSLLAAADEMLRYLAQGALQRHTGETRLNRESSRSHSVFVIK